MEERKQKFKEYIEKLIDKTERAVYIKTGKSILFDVEVSESIIISDGICEELLNSTLSLLQALYGAQSPQPVQFNGRFNSFTENPNDWCQYDQRRVLEICNGKLKSMLNDIEYGLIDDLESRISAEIFGDFLALANEALEKGHHIVAAIIGSAALEDALKRIAEKNGGNIDRMDMQNVANYLKSKQILKGTTGKHIDRFVILRNKALHAEWNKVESPEVGGLLGLTEQIIREHLSTI
ncbi:MAG TPA: hypothetical protein PLW44_08780 [Chitinophagales bacterium]|nr:hypothetical protein [Chitinophagales bacterium]